MMLTLITPVVIIAGAAAFLCLGKGKGQTSTLPTKDLFRLVSCPTWEFQMEGVDLRSFLKNGTEVRLQADKIRGTPLRRGGITFINYSRLAIENARVRLRQEVGTRADEAGPALREGNPIEILNIFRDLVGGSAKLVLEKEDLTKGPGNSRVVVEISASPIRLEIRAPDNSWIRISGDSCLVGMQNNDVVLSGEAEICLSNGQKISAKRIHFLGSFKQFFVEEPYAFESDGRIIEGKNNSFAIEQGRMRRTERGCASPDKGVLNPVRMVDAFLARGMAKGNTSLTLFSQLFLGGFEPSAGGLKQAGLKGLDLK
ncbi:MAG: hypothetical protein J7M32_12265 [Deltaproteobacteria bacterium]|nr:hypothetical protein [Deltaproteobacteria bacterium]